MSSGSSLVFRHQQPLSKRQMPNASGDKVEEGEEEVEEGRRGRQDGREETQLVAVKVQELHEHIASVVAIDTTASDIPDSLAALPKPCKRPVTPNSELSPMPRWCRRRSPMLVIEADGEFAE